MNERETECLLRKIRELSIQDKAIVAGIVKQLSTATIPTPTNNNKEKGGQYVTSDGIRLEIGDRVRILNNRKTGKIGDTARVTKFNKKFVALELERNKSHTQRDPKYIAFVGRDKRK